MAKKPFLSDIDMNGNEVQNVVIHKVATTPAGVRSGQIWFNTSDNYLYYYNGTVSTAIGYLPPATVSSLGGVIVGTNISVDGDGKISVASASNATAGVIRIATDTEATAGTATNLVITPAQLASAIATAHIGAMVYKGTWDITSATDFSGITLPVKKGYFYRVSGTGPKTIGGIEWNAGDHIVIEADVAAGGTISQVSKVDNTEGSDIVRLDATQTLTNKTIDADDNTIADLTTSNFKSGTIVTTVGSTGSDSKLPTEQAVREAIDGKKFTVANPALTATSGLCTWSISNTLATADVVCSVREVATGNEVMCDITYTASTITVKINSSSNIAASVYKAVVVG